MEGTTHIDSIEMAIYVCHWHFASHSTSKPKKIQEVWYTEDATKGGHLHPLREWWNALREIKPEYGYFVNPTKC